MNRSNNKPPAPPETAAPDASGERRRLGKIVHDDRGSASVEWHDAPADYERPVLNIENSAATGRGPKRDLGRLSIASEDTFNPYQRSPEERARNNRPRDLKKLSEWIKLMREMEERKKRGDNED